MPAGQRCQLTPAAGFVPLGGPLAGPREFAFTTGAPIVLAVQPNPGSRIEEDQHFWLRLNGAPDPARIASSAWCEVEGLGERVPVTIVEGPAREELLRQRRRDAPAAHMLLLACQRPFPAEAGVRLVWRAGKQQLTGSRPDFTPDFKPGATEVIGVPLPQTGYHVVEVESRILGASLLASRAPM